MDDLFTMDQKGTYFYRKGYNPVAVAAVLFSGILSLASVVVPKLFDVVTWLPQYSWFVGFALGFSSYYLLAMRANVAGAKDRPRAAATVDAAA